MRHPLVGPDPLSEAHNVLAFDCGKAPLNDFLKRYALQNQRNGTARTYVGCHGIRVVGYYSLCAASVEPSAAPERVLKGIARHPVPMTLLARLAVDVTEQGKGVGSGLLKDALKRFLSAQEIVASRGLITHAKDDDAKAFYERWGFEPSPIDPYHLFLLTKDIKKSLGF